MITIKECSKSYDMIKAVDHLELTITDREIFGMVGTNGAGKSTLLRMMSGILKPDQGEILVDGTSVFENPEVKKQIFFIPDEPYFPGNYTMKDMALFYESYYDTFNVARFMKLAKQFQLDQKRRISTFSKGMKKQVMMLLGVCAETKYLLCDETFDGLDPVMRQAMKSLLALEISDREFTPVLASHNLREMEDICENVGLLHKGGILLSRNLEEMKMDLHKVQCVFAGERSEEQILAKLKSQLDILKITHQGSLLLMTIRGRRDEILERIRAEHPIFCEMLPLTFEEIFISETEVAGYEIKNLF